MNKNKLDTPSIGNGLVQRVEVEEPIRRKWVDFFILLFSNKGFWM